jgi:ABC-2 type transport system ATP-binding protein
MPVLAASGAGVRHRRRWLFRDLDLAVGPGELVAVVGPPGSGRTTLLLALARRFRLSAGEVSITGRAALGHVPGVTDLEPVFTVAEHVRERLALLGRSRREAAAVDLYGLDPNAKGRDLSPFERQLLGLVLARLADPALMALDGLDDGLDATEQEILWSRLAEIAASGTAIVLTARSVDPAHVAKVVRLGAQSTPDAVTIDAPHATGMTAAVPPEDKPHGDAAAVQGPAARTVTRPVVAAPTVGGSPVDAQIVDCSVVDPQIVDGPAVDARTVDASAVDVGAVDGPVADARLADGWAASAAMGEPAADLSDVGRATVGPRVAKQAAEGGCVVDGGSVDACLVEGTDGLRRAVDGADRRGAGPGVGERAVDCCVGVGVEL